MKDRLNLSSITKMRLNTMFITAVCVILTKYKAFVWNFATFARLPFGQFFTENSQTVVGSFSLVTFS